MTSTDQQPKPKTVIPTPLTCDITWLFQNVEGNVSSFRVDRKRKSCHTPRRNPDVERAKQYFFGFNRWASGVATYFKNSLFSVPSGHGLDLSKVNSNGIFVPVVALFEEGASNVKRIGPSDDAGFVYYFKNLLIHT
jgi:hypothetical protein